MARRRMLSPEIWHNQQFGSLTLEQRLLYIGLISMADDEGFFVADPRSVSAEIFPWDPRICGRRVQKNITALSKIGLIGIEINSGDKKIAIGFHPNWESWQRVEKKKPSQLRKLTSLCSRNESRNDSRNESRNDSSLREVKRREVRTPPTPPQNRGGRGGCENREPGPSPSSADWFAAAAEIKIDAKWATWIWERSRRLRPKLVATFPDDMPGVVFALACALDKELSARQGYGEAIRNPEAFCRTVIETGKRWPLPERPEIPWPGRQATVEQWGSYTSLGVKYAGVDYDLGAPPDWKPQ